MLWWSDKFGRGIGYQKDVQFAGNAGLYIENIHTPVHEQNFLSLDNLDGKSVFQNYLQCVNDCFEFSIPTMVIHLSDDEHPIDNLGLERLGIIIKEAEKYDIQIAFENLSNLQNLALVLGSFFLTVVREESITKAANVLHITQPTFKSPAIPDGG